VNEKGKKRVRVTHEFIEAVLKAEKDEIPEDARLLALDFDPKKYEYQCVFESEEWERTVEGQFIKELGR